MQLVISGLSKTYSGGVRALDNVSMTIPTGMLGPNSPNIPVGIVMDVRTQQSKHP